MPGVNGERDWTEPPYRRLDRVERSVAQGVADIAQLKMDVERNTENLARLTSTLETMTSDELSELRRRADMPRRILMAVAVPVLVAVITALILTGLGHVGAI